MMKGDPRAANQGLWRVLQFTGRGVGLALLVLGTSGCALVEIVTELAADRREAAQELAASTSTPAPIAPSPSPSAAPPTPSAPPRDPAALFQDAMDIAFSAASIASSAQSSADWELVASRWQEAIALLQAIPAGSPNRSQAQAKIAEYQRNVAIAREKVQQTANLKPPVRLSSGAPSESPVAGAAQGAIAVPIKRRIAGTPVIDVSFNGGSTYEMIVDTGASMTLITQPMAAALNVRPEDPNRRVQVNTANAKGIELPVGTLKTLEVREAKVENLPVAIAGPELDIGLLGQDFFGQYDVTIKESSVEFQNRASAPSPAPTASPSPTP